MVIKTGVDIIEVERIKDNIEKYEDKFLNKVFTKNEIEYCESKKMQKYQSYAARFAAKEAVFKSISELLNNKFDIEWKDIEVLKESNGRPYVRLNDNLINKLDKQFSNNVNIDISISHINELAIASVVVCYGKMEV